MEQWTARSRFSLKGSESCSPKTPSRKPAQSVRINISGTPEINRRLASIPGAFTRENQPNLREVSKLRGVLTRSVPVALFRSSVGAWETNSSSLVVTPSSRQRGQSGGDAPHSHASREPSLFEEQVLSVEGCFHFT